MAPLTGGSSYTPVVSSPLNPGRITLVSRSQKHPKRARAPGRASGPVSLTQKLLREKAAAAWRLHSGSRSLTRALRGSTHREHAETEAESEKNSRGSGSIDGSGSEADTVLEMIKNVILGFPSLPRTPDQFHEMGSISNVDVVEMDPPANKREQKLKQTSFFASLMVGIRPVLIAIGLIYLYGLLPAFHIHT